MHTQQSCIQKYEECKSSRCGEIPRLKEFLAYAGMAKRDLDRVFGANSYSKLQQLAGDDPNRLALKRTPLNQIMQQYGELVLQTGVVPAYAEWHHRELRPTDAGLKNVHGIKWSEMPARFMEQASNDGAHGLEKAIEIISNASISAAKKSDSATSDFVRLVAHVRDWAPARRRNSEAEYKIELRKHLESLRYSLNEEFGESLYDLLVDRTHAIELKRDPNLAEYDRLFGQLARHLQENCNVIVVILNSSRNDKFECFTSLVDKYLSCDEHSIETIMKG